MRLKLLVLAVASVAVLAVAGLATAQTSGAHFTKNGFPVCTDIGTQLRCTAEVAGLGNETVLAVVDASGTATGVLCLAPGNGNPSPGQNPAVDVDTSGSQEITNIKNGRARVNVSTADPTVTPEQAGCQNNNWGVSIEDVEFTDYTLTISQGGVTLFTCTGSFSPASTDGESDTPTCV